MWTPTLTLLLVTALARPGIEQRADDSRRAYAAIYVTPDFLLIRRTEHGLLYRGHTKGLRYAPRLHRVSVGPYAIPKWYKKVHRHSTRRMDKGTANA